MATRRNLRRKVVLALHVVRRCNSEKQLAHTLDITENSARLGGLNFLLEPGEVVEIKRGAVKARFEVIWMGAPGTSLDGQAGIRSMEPNKNIWGVDLPNDENDLVVNVSFLRNSVPQMKQSADRPAGRRKHERYPCNGSASIKTATSSFALHGEVKDISQGGVYVELTSPMSVGTDVTIGLKIEGSWIEFTGNVRTSYPMVGMGIAFHKLTPDNMEKLTGLLGKLKRRDSAEKSEYIVEFASSRPSDPKSQSQNGNQQGQPETYPLRVLALACQNLANNFDSWQSQHSQADIEELRLAVTMLQGKLSPPQHTELAELLAGALPGGNA